MRENNRGGRKPQIIVGEADQDRLIGLANAIQDRQPEIAEALLAEMERAKVLPTRAVPPHVVRMGSSVEYRSDDGQQRTVTLVFPGEADIAQGRVSVLTPIGTALIGLSKGQSIAWTGRDGRRHRLTVLEVRNVSVQDT